jgi:IS30 family transposase
MLEPIHLSHETIYSALYAMPKGHLRSRILSLLRRKRKQRRPRAPGKPQRPFIDSITLIDHRPEEVNLRLIPGHWEGDLIKGKLNQSRVRTLVERWFALQTEKQLRRGVHRSTKELEQAIRTFIRLHNNDPKPFVWHKTADQILDSVARFCTRTSGTGY